MTTHDTNDATANAANAANEKTWTFTHDTRPAHQIVASDSAEPLNYGPAGEEVSLDDKLQACIAIWASLIQLGLPEDNIFMGIDDVVYDATQPAKPALVVSIRELPIDVKAGPLFFIVVGFVESRPDASKALDDAIDAWNKMSTDDRATYVNTSGFDRVPLIAQLVAAGIAPWTGA